MTPNGKVDRRRCRHRPPGRRRGGGRHRPRTPAEDAVAAVWAAVLGIDEAGIGPDDDFFALGGHSMLAATLAARLQDQSGTRVHLADVFERPTLSDRHRRDHRRARHRARRRAGHVARGSPPRAAARAAVLRAAAAVVLTLDDPGSAAYNIPLAARITGPLDVAALRQAIHWLVDRHEVLRSVIEEGPDGSRPAGPPGHRPAGGVGAGRHRQRRPGPHRRRRAGRGRPAAVRARRRGAAGPHGRAAHRAAGAPGVPGRAPHRRRRLVGRGHRRGPQPAYPHTSAAPHPTSPRSRCSSPTPCSRCSAARPSRTWPSRPGSGVDTSTARRTG